MPIGYPGNAITKEARAKAGGGFESAIEVPGGSGGGSALAYSISGSTLTVTTDGTNSFGAKPIADKPKFVWLADDGLAPNSTLGRDAQWGSGTTNLEVGTISTEQVGQGQTQSVAFDHNTSGAAALSEVIVGTQRKKMIFRRRFEDFTVYEATAIRTRIDKPIISGTLPSPGDTVTGQTTGATGIVQEVKDDGATRWAIFYEPVGGSINDDPTVDFDYQEVMSWPSGSSGNAEFVGTFRTFNNKVLRFFPEGGGKADIYFGDGVPGYTPARPQLVVEGTISGFDITGYSQVTYAKEWNTEIFMLNESSAIDVNDGWAVWRKNDTEIVGKDSLLTTVNTEFPDYKNRVFQAQVSGGAQPGSTNYWDYIYADDSHYFIQIRDSVSGRFIVLPVKSWADQQIEAEYLNFVNWTHIDVYKDGVLEGSVAR